MRKALLVIFPVIFLLAISAVGAHCYYHVKVYPVKLVEEKYSPREWIKDKEGDIAIYGWKVKRVHDKPDTYFVSYLYATGKDREKSVKRGWSWEINTEERLVKYIAGDDELEAKYNAAREYAEEPVTPRFYRKSFYEYKKERIEESRARWRRLKKGLGEFQVRDILGEPKRVDAYNSSPSFIQWSYPNGGTVRFYRSGIVSDKTFKLDAWKEPVSGSKLKWRRLQKGLSEPQVSDILGEAKRVDAYASSPPFIQWTYPNGGSIRFYRSGMFFSRQFRVQAWKEPFWKEP
ncbi:MAG: hypothetical protein KKD11_01030 [Candidatus Omnitrophica bacterium]|nr:hypothetical protein [Candidatus Omnitrophota bacterium]